MKIAMQRSNARISRLATDPPVDQLNVRWVLILQLCLCVAFTLHPGTLEAQPAQIYVATDGNDSWSGSIAVPNAARTDGPVVSLEQARNRVRELRKNGQLTQGAIVQIRRGDYELLKTFSLTEQDSGSADAPIIYQAYKDESVSLHGGKVIARFQLATNPGAMARLPKSARGKVWQADLKSAGVTDLGEVAVAGKRIELFFNDKPMQVARWPNEGFISIGEVIGGKPFTNHGHKGDRVGMFTYSGDRPQRWEKEPDIWLHGYWFWDWSDSYQRVRSIDPEKRVMALRPPFHGYGYRSGQHFYALNLLSELDSPGEWYIDRSEDQLYFWPPASLRQGTCHGLGAGNTRFHEQHLVGDTAWSYHRICSQYSRDP